MVTSGDADDAQPAGDARPAGDVQPAGDARPGTTSDVTPDPETTPETASPDSARGPDSEVRAYRREPQDREPERVGRAGLVLRMLRLGAVLTLPVLWCTPWMSMLPFGQKTSASLIVWPLLFLGGAWLLFPLSREGPMSRVLSVVVLVMADEVTLHSVVRAVWDWWSTYRRWGVTSNRSLYIAASLLALGLFLTSHYLVRTRYPAAPLNLQGAGLRSGTYAVVRRITIGTAPLPPWHRLTILPLVLLPPLLLVGSVLVLPGVPQPVTQQLASRVPEDARPAMPTTVGKAVAWTRETGPAVLDVAAGARGPLVLTKDGLEALRPEDGTTLWRYHRDRARYVDLGISHKVYLVVSPDRHYVAFCIEAPASGDHGPNALTTVLDTVTGETVGEWPSYRYSRVQLTDSAVLVGNDAILLRDGSVLGQVPDGRTERGCNGTAGHSTFVVDAGMTPLSRGGYSADLRLFPQDGLGGASSGTVLSNVAYDLWNDHNDRYCTIVDGWMVVRTEIVTPDGTAGKGGGQRYIYPWETRAIDIDEVAASGSVEGARSVPLGASVGVNQYASLATGTLVTYPPYPEMVSRNDIDRKDGPWVGAVFNPATRTVSTGESDALAAARMGCTLKPNESGEGVLSIEMTPGDGSPGLVARAAEPTSVFSSLAHLDSVCVPLQLRRSALEFSDIVKFVVTPGATVVVLDTDYSISRYVPHTIRVYGVR